MYLTSSLDPTSAKSRDHYIVLHHDNRLELTELPRSYSDLKSQVKRLFQFNKSFCIETDELNICAGKRVRIPGNLWGPLAELLGNIHIVLAEDALDSHLQSAPEANPDVSNPEASFSDVGPESGSDRTSYETTVPAIRLSTPLVEDEFVVINIGKIDVEAIPSTKLTIQLLDDKLTGALSIVISPIDGSISFTSGTNQTNSVVTLKEAFPHENNNYIFISRDQMYFKIVFDTRLIGTVVAPEHHPLSNISYDLGSGSTFKGPISENVYISSTHLQENFAPYSSMFPPFDRSKIHEQLLFFDQLAVATLEKVRQETISFNRSASGVKCSSHELLPGPSTNVDCILSPSSVFIITYHLPEDITSPLEITFSNTTKVYQMLLKISIRPTEVQFSQGKFDKYHTTRLSKSMHTAGDHSVMLLNVRGKIHHYFDLRQSSGLTKVALIKKSTDEVSVDLPTCKSARLDIYQLE